MACRALECTRAGLRGRVSAPPMRASHRTARPWPTARAVARLEHEPARVRCARGAARIAFRADRGGSAGARSQCGRGAARRTSTRSPQRCAAASARGHRARLVARRHGRAGGHCRCEPHARIARPAPGHRRSRRASSRARNGRTASPPACSTRFAGRLRAEPHATVHDFLELQLRGSRRRRRRCAPCRPRWTPTAARRSGARRRPRTAAPHGPARPVARACRAHPGDRRPVRSRDPPGCRRVRWPRRCHAAGTASSPHRPCAVPVARGGLAASLRARRQESSRFAV